jgi:amino acid adenylation domain-containing protein
VVGKQDLCSVDGWEPEEIAGDAIAYMMFTSGSTGTPKAVGVTHRNLRAFLDTVAERYHFTSDDRFSQTFALNLDLAVFDLFVAWQCGACVCIPTKEQMLNIGRDIDSERLSVWFSTPSTAVMIKRLGQLEPEQHPALRLSLFCGEALPVEITQAWAASAPNSRIENLYGPTELTLCCTYYHWDAERTVLEAESCIVPIGEPFPGMTVLVADEALVEVAPGTVGELLMTGPQLPPGYWRDVDKTKAAFVVPPGKDTVYYRTGDRVLQPLPGQPLTYLGRQDNQILIRGVRVELGEIEAALREEAKVDMAVAMGRPRRRAPMAWSLLLSLPKLS